MNNVVLLLVLVASLVAGYFVGDYRGKDAREALKKAIETGKTLDSEREATIANLKTELGGINDKHQRELEVIRKNNEAKMAEWRRTKNGLDDAIKRSNAGLAESDNKLNSLIAQRDAASGTGKAGLDLDIQRLRQERENLQREIAGDTCLKTPLPHSVFDAMNETSTAGSK